MRNLELVMIVLVLLDGVEMVILACFQTALGGHVSSKNALIIGVVIIKCSDIVAML